MPEEWFNFEQVPFGGGTFWRFVFNKHEIAEIPGGPMDGFLRYVPADGNPDPHSDRIKYHTARCALQHREVHLDGTPGHGFVTVLRFHIQVYGPSLGRIIDNNMPELQPQGLVSYPYDGETTFAVDHSRPGGYIDVFHQRDPLVHGVDEELLWTIPIPEVSAEDSNVRWYYQLAGRFVGEYNGQPFIRIIVSSLNKFYGYKVRGASWSIPTRFR